MTRDRHKEADVLAPAQQAISFRKMSDEELTALLTKAEQVSSRMADKAGTDALMHEVWTYQIELEMQNRELRAAQVVLEESRERYAALYDYAPVAYCTLDELGVVNDVNPAAAALFGAARAQLLGKPLATLLRPGESKAFFSFLQRVHRHARHHMLETQLRGNDGDWRHVRLISTAAPTVDGRKPLYHTALFDITAERRQQEILRLHSVIMNEMNDGVILMQAADGTILETNPAFDRSFGYDTGELLGRRYELLVGKDSGAGFANRMQAGTWKGEVHHVTKQGAAIWGEATVTVFDHNRYGPVRLAVHRDITDRKLAEQKARQRQQALAHTSRVNIAGQLASSLAHELTQPLMAIEHFNHALLQRIQKGDYDQNDLVKALENVSVQAQRGSEIIRRLRRFIRRGKVQTVPVQIEQALADAIALLEPLLTDNAIDVEVIGAAALPPVSADPIQIEQVFVNLLRNGAEAVARADGGSRRIGVNLAVQDGYLEIAIADSGPGLAPELAEQIFEVFETTKADGMGLGLAISRSIVAACGGRLWFEPAPSGGAVFRFTLPVTAATDSP